MYHTMHKVMYYTYQQTTGIKKKRSCYFKATQVDNTVFLDLNRKMFILRDIHIVQLH
jgi:hypothetical protein